MKYESRFVSEARATALARAKSAQQRVRKSKSGTPLDVTHTSSLMSFPQPAVSPSPRKGLSTKPWNSDYMNITSNDNKGLFDPSLKKVEIFKLRSRSGTGRGRMAMMLDEDRDREGDRTKENTSQHNHDKHTVIL